MNGRRKITLSIDEEFLREARAMLAREGKSLSSVVEETLSSIIVSKWVDELAGELELGRLDPIDPSTIPKTRPRGLDAEKIIKKERSRSIENLSDNEQTLIF